MPKQKPSLDFAAIFQALTGHRPFPWQTALYESLIVGDFPDACDLPTGLGKTSVIAIWLIALAVAPKPIPRRLVYVVNRRTVVDQSTQEAESFLKRLKQAHGTEGPLGDALSGVSSALRAAIGSAAGNQHASRTVRRQPGMVARSGPASGDRRHRRHDRQPVAVLRVRVRLQIPPVARGFSRPRCAAGS